MASEQPSVMIVSDYDYFLFLLHTMQYLICISEQLNIMNTILLTQSVGKHIN